MAIKYDVTKHTVVELGSLTAQHYGKHMVSLNITEDTDNGRIVKVGEMEGLDNYKVEEATTIDAYVAMKGANGLWLVVINEVKEPRTALIYQEPIVEIESPRKLASISNFYNDPADGPVRGYVLDEIDRFWLSDEGFSGTPDKGKKINAIEDGKLKIAD